MNFDQRTHTWHDDPLSGRNIRRWREARGWSLAELEQRIGVARGQLGYIEAGLARLDTRQACEMAALMAQTNKE